LEQNGDTAVGLKVRFPSTEVISMSDESVANRALHGFHVHLVSRFSTAGRQRHQQFYNSDEVFIGR
jgi:hypothetical protein